MENEAFISQDHFNTPPSSLLRRLWESKVVRIVIGSLILAELIWAGYTLTRPVTNQPVNEQSGGKNESGVITNKNTGKLIVDGPTQVKVNDTFKVNINIESTSPTDGTDLVVKYNPALLEVVPGADGPLSLGNFYPQFAINNLDSPGVIAVSEIINPGVPTSVGSGSLGSLTFKAKAAGNAQISLEFVAGQTSDSNITDTKSGKDILESVENLSIKVQ